MSFDTEYAFNVGFETYDQIDTQYKGGANYRQFRHEKSFKTGSWQWLAEDVSDSTLRVGVGFTAEDHSSCRYLQRCDSQ